MGNRPQQVAPVPFVFRLLPIPQPFLRRPELIDGEGRAFQHGPQELFLIFSKLLSRLRRNPQKTEPAFTAVNRPYTVFAVSEAVAVGVRLSPKWASSRSFISLAALLVKVTAVIWAGSTPRSSTR